MKSSMSLSLNKLTLVLRWQCVKQNWEQDRSHDSLLLRSSKETLTRLLRVETGALSFLLNQETGKVRAIPASFNYPALVLPPEQSPLGGRQCTQESNSQLLRIEPDMLVWQNSAKEVGQTYYCVHHSVDDKGPDKAHRLSDCGPDTSKELDQTSRT